MAESYPWGAQAPQPRLTKLTSNLQKLQAQRDRYLEGHKAKISEFDENERAIKADIRVCESILEKEKNEAQSAQFTKLVSKIAVSGSVDLGALLADPDLEKKLLALAEDANRAATKKSGKASAKSGGDAVPDAGVEAQAA